MTYLFVSALARQQHLIHQAQCEGHKSLPDGTEQPEGERQQALSVVDVRITTVATAAAAIAWRWM